MIKLSEKELTIVTQILKKHIPNHNFFIFGSRAKGNVHEYSDLDIAIEGNGKLDLLTLANLRDEFQDSNLPFRVDLVDLNNISPEFKVIIQNTCVPLPI